MAKSYKDPLKIHITMNPDELRDLANRMEKRFPSIRLGESIVIAYLADEPDYVVTLLADQEYFDNKEQKIRKYIGGT